MFIESITIKLVDVCKSFDGLPVLKGLNLEIERGRTTVIIGRSGGGKSVLLKHMIGLLRPEAGQVLVDGVDITRISSHELNEVRKKFGMLFQEAALFDSMNVGDNVAFPLREHSRKPEAEIQEIVREKLRQVGLKDVERKLPAELSGGMKKRVGLARAIALDPQIILFDEPTTGLDPIMADAINNLIIDTHRQTGATYVVISHDIEGAFKIGHKIAMLYDGKIVLLETPDRFRTTTNEVVRQFIEGRADGPISIG